MRGREGTKQQSTIFRTGKREMEERIGERARERDAAISSKSKATINYFENRKERGRETGKREMEERMGGDCNFPPNTHVISSRFCENGRCSAVIIKG